MTLPTFEDLRTLLGDEPGSPTDDRLVRTPMHPILSKDWLQDAPPLLLGGPPNLLPCPAHVLTFTCST